MLSGIYSTKMSLKTFLFPLPNISLQIGSHKPLNIYEPRYLQMVEDSINQEIPISLVFAKTQFEVGDQEIPHEIFHFIKPITGLGHPRMISRNIDGSVIIMLPGEYKGRITKVLKSDTPYIICEYEKIEEVQKLRNENILLLRNLQLELEEWISKSIDLTDQRDILRTELSEAGRIVGLYTEFIVMNPEARQKVLEMDNINEKIHFLALNG
ncbi:hypothetical protein A9Q84_08530 [Halobacteriovorax marinus]|uniref:Lon N-terminal domain-containing protein n=1 Tax=Halobacteriovorax marinus TaxID=97084 RepID=A0A1Y5F665_9BACT|nr:hypothetical protein A9Q84_08530 [Halobacteriovorax marinus]